MSAARTAAAVWVAGVGLLAAAAVLDATGNSSFGGVLAIGPLLLVYGTVGLVLAARAARNVIGWIFLFLATMFGAALAGEAFARGSFRTGGDHAAATVVAAVANALQGAILIGSLATMLMVFPDGRLPSPRWRPVGGATAAATFGALLAGAFVPGRLATAPIENPTALSGTAASIASAVQGVSYLVLVGVVVLAAGGIVHRFRRASGVRRQQLKWLVAAAAVMAACWICAIPLWVISTGWSEVVWTAAFVLGAVSFPLATGVAILRYRLYDIDVIIRRTAAYALLVVVLAAVYLAGVAGLGAVLRSITGASGALAVTLSTLAVAAAFQPARRRIQRAVDRRFARDRYDAERALAGLAARLRDHVELETIRTDVLDLVSSTVRPRHASVWLRAVTIPERPPGTTEVS